MAHGRSVSIPQQQQKECLVFLPSEDGEHSSPRSLPRATFLQSVNSRSAFLQSGFRLCSLCSDPRVASLQVGMFKIHPEIPESMSLEAKAFILRCFEPDPDRRATALDLLTDEFLTVTSRKKKSKGSFTGGAARSSLALNWASCGFVQKQRRPANAGLAQFYSISI